MTSRVTLFPNVGSHAWLHRFERAHGLRIGDLGRYPLPEPVQAFPVRIEQRFGFSSEPRARWDESEHESVPTLEWSDFGVFAPLGLLPDHFTESTLHAAGGKRLRRFVADLTQRLAHFYYRSWAHLRPECEAGRADDRFADLLAALAGTPGASVPHLSWHRPNLQQLPRLGESIYGISVSIERYSISRVRHMESVSLGVHQLSRGRLGQYVRLFGAGFVRILVRPRHVTQFLSWRKPDHDQRRQFERLVEDCLPIGNRYELRVLASSDLALAYLGASRLGQSRFPDKGVSP
jgi:predicted component of type VI protein secretion system